MKIVGHIFDALAKVVYGLILEWKVLQMIGRVDWKLRVALKGTLMSGDGRFPAFMFVWGKGS